MSRLKRGELPEDIPRPSMTGPGPSHVGKPQRYLISEAVGPGPPLESDQFVVGERRAQRPRALELDHHPLESDAVQRFAASSASAGGSCASTPSRSRIR